MTSDPLLLEPHWDNFIQREIASGRYATVNEVVHAALRAPEERGQKLQALQDHLAEGARQAREGEFAAFSVEDVTQRAEARRNTNNASQHGPG